MLHRVDLYKLRLVVVTNRFIYHFPNTKTAKMGIELMNVQLSLSFVNISLKNSIHVYYLSSFAPDSRPIVMPWSFLEWCHTV